MDSIVLARFLALSEAAVEGKLQVLSDEDEWSITSSGGESVTDAAGCRLIRTPSGYIFFFRRVALCHNVTTREHTGGIMAVTQVSIRELKSRLSHYLRLTKAGDIVVITERGTPIGRIVPASAPLNERIEAMVQAGLIIWNRKKLNPIPPVAKARGRRTVADLLIEDRE